MNPGIWPSVPRMHRWSARIQSHRPPARLLPGGAEQERTDRSATSGATVPLGCGSNFDSLKCPVNFSKCVFYESWRQTLNQNARGVEQTARWCTRRRRNLQRLPGLRLPGSAERVGTGNRAGEAERKQPSSSNIHPLTPVFGLF